MRADSSRLDDRHAAMAQLLGELDDEDAVFRGEADQHRQPIWR